MARKTQTEEVYDYMRQRGSITALEALYELGCMRLASRISDLKKANIDVRRRMKAVRCGNGRIAHVAEYYLEDQSNVETVL